MTSGISEAGAAAGAGGSSPSPLPHRAPVRDLEVGIGCWTVESTYVRPRAHSYMYRDAVCEARLVEDLGFDVFWLAEHHHSYGGYSPSLIQQAAYVAAATKRIVLATGVLVPNHHGGQRVAEASAAFDAVAPNRLRLALATGYWPDEFAAMGIDPQQRHGLFRRDLDTLVSPEWRDRLRRVDLFSGQNTDAGLKRAGRYGLGLLIGEGDLKTYLQARAVYEEAWQAAGHSHRPRVIVLREVWAADDARHVEWVKGRLLEMWRGYAIHIVDQPNAGSDGDAASSFAAQVKARDAVAESLCWSLVSGSSAAVVDELGPLVEAGVDGVAFRVRFDGTGGPVFDRCLEALGTEVMPQLRRIAR